VTETEKWQYISSLDEELLKGGVVLSEWTSSLIRNADLAFVHGAHLACVITAMAAIEAHLRQECQSAHTRTLAELIEHTPMDALLREELHAIREFRNSWTHIRNPIADEIILIHAEHHESEQGEFATRASRALRQVVYAHQYV
jgi:hypothetical protein